MHPPAPAWIGLPALRAPVRPRARGLVTVGATTLLPLRRPARLLGFLLLAASTCPAADDGITWLVRFDGQSSPAAQGWQPVGTLAAAAAVASGALRLADASETEFGAFRAAWTPDPSREIVVEARVRVESVKGRKGGTSMWPWTEGAPVGILVSDGRHQEGLVLRPEKIATFLDRVAVQDCRREFHTYRLVIRGNDLSIAVDGVVRIKGEGAFWKPAASAEAFIQFGSNSPTLQGEAHWEFVRLGLRRPATPAAKPALRLTLSAPWEIPAAKGTNPIYEHQPAPTRPFLHDLGRGLLLLSVAQGPDAVMEPYGVLKSTDAGRTWQPVPGLQAKTFAPQSITRRADGTILGVSRWTARYAREDGVYLGMTYRFDAQAENFTMFESTIRVPEGMGEWMAFNRDLFEQPDGVLLASVYGAAKTGRRAMLLRSTDGGATWTHHATLGPRPEPAVVRFSPTEMMALLRNNGWMPLDQIWSSDGGKTWTPPRVLEEGSVDPDLTLLGNGILACSYGRPGSNLMFSLDQGKTWIHHTVIAESKGFNYTAVREISPGRLLYVHDAPRLQALYIDVAKLP